MGNLVTNQDFSAECAQYTNTHSPVSISIVAALLVGFLLAVPSLVALKDQIWPSSINAALVLLSPFILISGFAAHRKSSSERHHPFENLPTGQAHQSGTQYNDELARQISWSVMQPHITGESQNCMICRRSDQTRLMFAPDLSLQYTALIIAALVTGWVLSISMPGTLSTFVAKEAIATVDPGLKTFIYMFSAAVLFYMTLLIRKPVRSLVFNKDPGIFWIEQKRVFGWKAAESAQMPLAQISALQIVRYGRHGVYQQNGIEAAENQTDVIDAYNSHSNQTRKQHGYRNYEINVVFRNAERVNIINHSNGTAIRHDAETLAAFLGVPVWDGAPTQ